MACTITVETPTGERSYTGQVVHWGPSQVMLLLTEPPATAGHTVLLPLANIVSRRRIRNRHIV